jgi:hypothetical protein
MREILRRARSTLIGAVARSNQHYAKQRKQTNLSGKEKEETEEKIRKRRATLLT